MNLTALAKHLEPWADHRRSYRRAAALWFGAMGTAALAGVVVGGQPAWLTLGAFAWHTALVLGGMRVSSRLNERRLDRALAAVNP